MRIARNILMTAVLLGVMGLGSTVAYGADITVPASASAPGASIPTFARQVSDKKTGALNLIGTPAGRPVDLDALRIAGPQSSSALTRQSSKAPTSRADLALKAFAPAFGVRDASRDLRLSEQTKGASGRTTLKYTQTHQGLPVIAGELIVNLDAKGDMLSMNGEASPALDIDTTPGIDASAAAAAARTLAVKKYAADSSTLKIETPALEIYDPRLLGPDDLPARLVLRTEAKGLSSTGSVLRLFILIDARTGAIALDFNQVAHAKSLITYDGNGQGNPLLNTQRCTQADPTCAGGDTDEVNAHKYASEFYDFLWNEHTRDSYDDPVANPGATLQSVAHWYDVDEIGQPECPNAMWDGTRVVYCNGMVVDDIAAHEWAHALTEKTSNLFYYYQAGAINESLSDIWGELMDQQNGSGDDATTKWLLGEGSSWPGAVYPGDPSGTLRDMQNPEHYLQPDKMSSPTYKTSALDAGGVHTNSGISNKAAQLMVDGSSFPGPTVGALGWHKTLDIFYEAQTTLLTSGSDFQNLHDALYQACMNKAAVAEEGVVEGDCANVREATLAVEMDQDPSADFNPDATPCPTGFAAPVVTWSDDHEGASLWMVQNLQGTANAWHYVQGYAYSGIWALDSLGASVTGDSAAISPFAPVYSDTFLHVRHSFEFETGISGTPMDGGVVEYSTDGTHWSDLTTWNDGGQAPNSIATSKLYGSPLAGRYAFSGTSHGYVSTRFDLRDLSGKNVRIRVRTASDESGESTGWTVDDVAFVRCSGGPPAPVTTILPLNQSIGGDGWYFGHGLDIEFSSSKPGRTEYQWDVPDPDLWKWTNNDPIGPTEGIHTLYYRTIGDDSTREPTKSKIFKLDYTAPKSARIKSFGSTTPFAKKKAWKVSWGGATDPYSGVKSYDLRYRGAAWSGGFGGPKTWKSAVAGGSATFKGKAGYTYCFSARARDKAGNVSAWSAERCITNPVNNTQLTHSSGWSKRSGSGYYLSTYSSTTKRGSALKTPTKAKAKRISLVVTKCPSCGKVAVYRGSSKLGTFNLKSSSVRKRVIVPVKNYSSVKSGVIRVVALTPGKKVIIEGLALGKK